jgi:type IV pilus assembly protein PilQ
MRTHTRNLLVPRLLGACLALAVLSVAYSARAEEPVVKFAKSLEEKKFTGKPITLNVKDADVTDVLRVIGDASGFNIIIHPQVTGKITITLIQVPWDQALDVVLQTLSLSAERNQSVLRVVPSELMIAEKKAERDTKLAAQAAEPRVTRIFPISFADPSELVKILDTYGVAETGNNPNVIKPVITVDKTTSSIVIRDIAQNVERMRRLIELLDVQIPQVLVEAKIVEASEDFGKTFGGNAGLFNSEDSGIANGRFLSSFSGANPVDRLIGDPAAVGGIAATTIPQPGVFQGGPALAAASANGGTIAASPVLAIFGSTRVAAALQMGESESKVNVISSPRTVVLSGKSATVNQVTARTIPNTVVTVGVAQTTFTSVTANLKLNVTPRVTNEGSVMMQLSIQKDVLEGGNGSSLPPSVAPRTMNTEVLVDSGYTLVIGGILSSDSLDAEGGFPFLRKIPILGTFFGNTSQSQSRKELMFFVTPRILNSKRAGVGTG